MLIGTNIACNPGVASCHLSAASCSCLHSDRGDAHACGLLQVTNSLQFGCFTPSTALQFDSESEEPVTAVAPKKDMVPYGQTIVNVDNEHSLIVVRASGGSTSVAMGPDSLDADVAIGAFEIEDLLVGPVCIENSYLARSSLPAQETFHDPSSDVASMQRAPSGDSTVSDDHFQDASEEVSSARAQQQALVLQYAKRTPKSPEYRDVDAEVHVKLKTLSFFGNRPTLGALMAIGDDISAAGAAKPPDAPAAAVQQPGADKQPSLHSAASGIATGAWLPLATLAMLQLRSLASMHCLYCKTICNSVHPRCLSPLPGSETRTGLADRVDRQQCNDVEACKSTPRFLPAPGVSLMQQA